MLVADLYERYDAPTVYIKEPSALIIINRTYRRSMPDKQLYEVTRGNWIVSSYRCKRAKYALAVSNGIVRQVYEIHRWFQTDERIRDTNRFRWRFDGIVAENLQHYVGGNVAHYIKPGSQNPVRYINC